MNNENVYVSIDQFVAACVQSKELDFKQFFPKFSDARLAKELKIKIKVSGVVASEQGFYKKSDIIKLYSYLSNNYKSEYGLSPSEMASLLT